MSYFFLLSFDKHHFHFDSFINFTNFENSFPLIFCILKLGYNSFDSYFALCYNWLAIMDFRPSINLIYLQCQYFLRKYDSYLVCMVLQVYINLEFKLSISDVAYRKSRIKGYNSLGKDLLLKNFN